MTVAEAGGLTAAEVRERVRAGGLLSSGRGVVAMLSGGRDSVCLLDVAVALCGAERVHALHVNYGLRAESDEDERHCRELCGRLGVEIEVVRASRERRPPATCMRGRASCATRRRELARGWTSSRPAARAVWSSRGGGRR